MKNFVSFLSALLLLAGTQACKGGDEGDDGKTTRPTYTVFKGKNLVAFGNSITADRVRGPSWAYRTETRLEFGDLYNGAFAGACWYKRERKAKEGRTIRTQDYTTDGTFVGYSNESNTSTEAYQRIINNCAVVHVQKYLVERNASRDPDVIIFSYGTNDDSSDAVIGSAQSALAQNDPTRLDLYTMAGAMKWCLVMLRERFPDAMICVAGPLQASTVEYPNKNAQNTKKIAVIEAICDGLSIPYFDCYNGSGITADNAGTYLADGLHPNASGQAVHADYIIRKLKELNPQ